MSLLFTTTYNSSSCTIPFIGRALDQRLGAVNVYVEWAFPTYTSPLLLLRPLRLCGLSPKNYAYLNLIKQNIHVFLRLSQQNNLSGSSAKLPFL